MLAGDHRHFMARNFYNFIHNSNGFFVVARRRNAAGAAPAKWWRKLLNGREIEDISSLSLLSVTTCPCREPSFIIARCRAASAENYAFFIPVEIRRVAV